MTEQFDKICIDRPKPAPQPMPVPAARPNPTKIPVQTTSPAPAAMLARDRMSAPVAKPVRDSQLPKVVIKDQQYNPVRNLLFKIRIHLKIIDLNILISHIRSLNSLSQFHRLVVVHPILSSYIIVDD